MANWLFGGLPQGEPQIKKKIGGTEQGLQKRICDLCLQAPFLMPCWFSFKVPRLRTPFFNQHQLRGGEIPEKGTLDLSSGGLLKVWKPEFLNLTTLTARQVATIHMKQGMVSQRAFDFTNLGALHKTLKLVPAPQQNSL